MPRTTEATWRDSLTLRWIGEMYVARADVVAVLLGRLSPGEPLVEGRVGARTFRHHLERWERLGFCRRRRLLNYAWVVPSRRGLAYAGLSLPPYEPVGHRLAHMHATAVVRLAVEAQLPELEWVSERELAGSRRERGGRWHRPDGLVDTTLVEVELTPKKAKELRQHMLEPQHPAGRTRVYFAPPGNVDTLRARLATIRAEVEQMPQGAPWIPTDVRPLPEVPGVSYNGVR